MVLTIDDSILSKIKLTEVEIKLEFSIFLYQNKKLTIYRASKLAGINFIEFQKQLALRNIPVHYSKLDLDMDLLTIESLEKGRI